MKANMRPSDATKTVTMLLAVFAVGSLLFVTWAMMRVSAWIVYHDSVWQQMDHEGARLEHYLAEAFLVAQHLFILPLEAVCGLVFLFLLWRRIFRSQRQMAVEVRE